MNNTFFNRRNLATLFIGFLSIKFYTLFFIAGTIERMIGLTASLVTIGIFIFHFIYFPKKEKIGKTPILFKTEFIFFMLCPFLSMLVAKYYHGQSFGLTLYMSSGMFIYLMYFLIHEWKIDGRDIEKMIYIIGVGYIFIFIIQYLIYPTNILNSRINVDRGTIRIFFPGGGFSVILYYLLVQKLLTEKFSWKLFVILLMAYAVNTFLQGTRMPILLLTSLTGLYIITGKRVKNRYFVVVSAVIMAVCLFLLFKDIFIELYNLSLKESEHTTTNPRVRAIKFFLTDFMPAKIAYFLGNGADHLSSPFGQKVAFYQIYFGLYQSDIGLIGLYVRFGALYAIAYLSILIRGIFMRLPSNLTILRYYFIGQLATLYYSGGPGGLAIVFLVYMIEFYKNKEKMELNAPT